MRQTTFAQSRDVANGERGPESAHEPRPATSLPPPDRHLRVGILGAGYIADWHAEALRSLDDVAIAAVCDRDSSRAEGLASRFGIAMATTSLDEMLHSGALDAVHVLLPPEHHARAARAVLEAGAHVFLEKPMGVDQEECASLIEIAGRHRVKIGVGHNFLYARVYEELRRDLRSGKLGPIDHVSIRWNKPLGQLAAGPFDSWLFRDPRHVLLEIGPHSFAHMADLMGTAEIVASRASDPVDLPGGRRFFRRWSIEAEAGRAAASLQFSFGRGFSEHSIHVRGGLAGATVDFERNTYTLSRHTAHGVDLDRYLMVAGEASALRARARSNLAHYALSKLKLSGRGNAYGEGIRLAMKAFYDHLRGRPADRRISAELGREVVALCVEAGTRDRPPASATSPPASPPPPSAPPRARPDVLLLGATGFIGKELSRQFQERGGGTRLLVRDASRVAEGLDPASVEVVVGDASRPADLERALEGVGRVVHLARSHSKTWDEFYRRDVLVTKEIAEACLKARVLRLIYSGTIDSFYAGKHAGTIGGDTPLDAEIDGRNNYARAKAAAEALLGELHRARSLPVVIVRPGIVIGRGGHPHHWGVGMWHWDSVCQVWGDGRSGLPIVLVEDVARAIVKAIDAPGIDGEAFNLVGPQCLSAHDYLDELDRFAGAEVRRVCTPPWKFFLGDVGKFAVKTLVRHPGRRLVSYRDWESRTQRATFDCSKARERLGWVPTSDRSEIIRRGIQVPVEEFLT